MNWIGKDISIDYLIHGRKGREGPEKGWGEERWIMSASSGISIIEEESITRLNQPYASSSL